MAGSSARANSSLILKLQEQVKSTVLFSISSGKSAADFRRLANEAIQGRYVDSALYLARTRVHNVALAARVDIISLLCERARCKLTTELNR